ncbi:glycosyltransferase family 4 protein [Lysinibacillus xylanilyticus]|uniref:glycosyltransferase family 4 protein n=1 Tax=Lysinibacillus xylanilyticus TaxID=582475 RepID=UPI00382CB9DC
MTNLKNGLDILLISPLPSPAGGIATWTEMYLKSELIKKQDVKVINTAVRGDRIYSFNNRKITEEIMRNISIYINLIKTLKKNKFDVAHLNSSCSTTGMIRDLLCAKKIKKNGYKLILQCHCNIPSMLNNKFSTWIFKELIKHTDTIIVLNSDSNQYVNKILKRESFIVSNFIDYKDINYSSIKYIAEEIKTIIFVGHVNQSKGCNEILEVSQFFPNINFRLIGNISSYYKNIDIPENVKLIGEVSKDNVLIEMKNADVLLFPSHMEGFPLVVLEAMACGLPVIGTPVGAIPEMIEENGGVLIDVGDVPAIISAVNEIQDPSIRSQISKWNQNKIKCCYSTEVVIKKICDIYEES